MYYNYYPEPDLLRARGLQPRAREERRFRVQFDQLRLYVGGSH
jgi:hypothetical protein